MVTAIHVPVAMRVMGTWRVTVGDCAVMMGCGAGAGCAGGGVVVVGRWSVGVPSAGSHIRRTAFSRLLLRAL